MGSEEQQRAVVTVTPSVVAAAAAATAAPQIQQLNVSDNSSMHIGPRFVNVTQNVHQDKVVKGRLLGLILEARAATDKRHLRCGVAVFICWALVVAGVLASYVAYVMLSNRSQRIDLDIKEPWYLRRADWTALPAFDIQFLKLPVRYALIGHSATETCTDRYNCTACMIKIQNDHQRKGWSDIGPNFFVGSKEGLVLEGRGANVHGAMVQGWNAKSQTIMFIGDYRMEHDRPYPAQMEHLAKLLDALVKAGTLHPEYVLLGHCQVVGHVEPPGVNLLKELEAFPHWDSRNITACQHWTEFESIQGVWHVVKTWAHNTTRGERIACAVALFALVICACAAGILATGRSDTPQPDKSPHEWNITRQMWLANPRGNDELPYEKKYLPLRMIIIQHTAGPECHRFQECAAVMKNLQLYYFEKFHYDVPYNFVIGNDARVYEGRGADLIGAHTYKYNRCALGLGFTGNYANDSIGTRPTSAQRDRVMKLIALGVERGLLHEKVMVLGARDVQDSESPGDALYAELRTWPQAPPNPRHFYNRYCDDIYQEITAPDSK